MALKTIGLAEVIKIGLPSVVLLAIGFTLAFQFVGPAPPQNIRIATGNANGSYYAFAQRYADYLKREGITLEIIESEGSSDNLKQLNQPDTTIDLALVQSGLIKPGDAPDLRALGSLYHEPLWVFHRNDLTIKQLKELAGKRIAIGREGSGTRALAITLLNENGVTDSTARFSNEGGTRAAEALLNNQVDVAMFVTAPDSQLVTMLIRNPAITLFSFSRAEAYARKFRYLSKVTLPEGVLDFSNNLPRMDVNLLAPSATLIAKSSFHPALTDLLLQAANDVHGGAGTFARAGRFPSPENCDISLSKDAKRYFTYGPPFLQRFLPFWLATMVDRLKVMLLPFVILLLPMFKIIPPIFQWRTRRRVVKWYKRLQEIDVLVRSEGHERLHDLLDEIIQMDKDVSLVSIPLGYADQLYNLRLHIDLIENRIEKALTKH
ncbi:hypothetical protein BVX99_01100 [bacterium F16]|nr:hypothetical protein BVX99_01100 [bacterium F16]